MRRMLLVAGAMLLSAPALAQVDSGHVAPGATYAFTSQEGWLGMGVSCSACSFQRSAAGTGRWTFNALPSVFSVDDGGPADRAGIRAGDTLVAIDGHALTSRQGGAAFGAVRPGQRAVIEYRRAGEDHTAQLVAVARPARGDADALARLQRLEAQLRTQQAGRMADVQRQLQQAQRQMQRTERQLAAQRSYLAEIMARMAAAQSGRSDSSPTADMRSYAAQLDSAAARWREADSAYTVLAPPPAPAFPAAPAAGGVAPAAPAAPAMAPIPPVAVAPPVAAVAPLPPAVWRREAGPVRFSGSLGDVLIEARGPGDVTTTLVSDSDVVITSRDMSVRLKLRVRDKAGPETPVPAPSPAPAPGATPRPQP